MILGYKEKTLIGIVILLVILLFLVPFASEEVDGLEKVAEEQFEDGNFDLAWDEADELGADVADAAPFPDYVAIFDEGDDLAAITSGIIGIIVVLGIFIIPALVVKYKKENKEIDPE